ncbi:hypothetical protein [Halocalculus aciditolerans]|uniref:Small CPxCG-related zinc finger protein n=1 Tax=Halocalculus aciditolerans TaxID=1383812 RepID=A0A830FGJ3_9EURY|nr:hypothetical protein [Halocalculus aciditolerans]GGL72334.1 hypothetical protein GCM10009039_32940 [Halocalculus aciditolerans]
MPTCPGCHETFDVDELDDHRVEGVHHVHCPGCGRALGTYNEHADRE